MSFSINVSDPPYSPRARARGLLGVLLAAAVMLGWFAPGVHAQTKDWWLTLALDTHLGWEVHRIIEHSRLTGSDNELFGPEETERQVTGLGLGVGPEVTVGWRHLWGRFGAATSTHSFSGNGTSSNYYLRTDLGYGKRVAVFVGGRWLRVGYEDMDSTGLADYDLSGLVIGFRCDTRKGNSSWGVRFDGCVGGEGFEAVYDRIRAHELGAMFDLNLTVGYRPTARPFQIELGYYVWAHSKPSRRFVPESTIVVDKIWQEYYPIWHGVVVRTSYWFGSR